MRTVASLSPRLSLAAAAILTAMRDAGPAPFVLDNVRDIDIRPIIKDRPARGTTRKARKGNKSGHMPHQGIGEIARRQRQIAAGQLRAANGLHA